MRWLFCDIVLPEMEMPCDDTTRKNWKAPEFNACTMYRLYITDFWKFINPFVNHMQGPVQYVRFENATIVDS